ncbi:M48 family metallopeptidase [Pseudobacteriovorax antillogorgiicola]|uniref:YgjP-like metallopeptidase domain-containing protein n=2 Tax=Pseudobacteriovorax antillogorgiicola TaxID=1513793 RepID=A0A1Y6CMW6_9BACT|nr:SprT family zinc-dependent metalloprotease [Pseudobacteriovorax antillogorgiicola]TCS44637.1 hypothetical protein EDD56_13270 [Pseudobacteriovorax antillogorgiicola]SMF78514.1 hypothetical protein SAMN06296036_13270 [Pseudobacteriovorax antillogorgiicola]
MIRTVEYGTKKVVYHINFTDRKTAALNVNPDQSIVVNAPKETSPKRLDELVLKRARWLLKQQREFAKLPDVNPGFSYKSGETHRYLGRQYRLKIVKSSQIDIKLKMGRIEVSSNEVAPEVIKTLLDRWFELKSQQKLEEKFQKCLLVFTDTSKKPRLRIKTMKKRWGSCTKNGTITLNPELIHCASSAIEYVIFHELSHLVEMNHSAKFYRILSKYVPNWEKVKERLDQQGTEFLL